MRENGKLNGGTIIGILGVIVASVFGIIAMTQANYSAELQKENNDLRREANKPIIIALPEGDAEANYNPESDRYEIKSNMSSVNDNKPSDSEMHIVKSTNLVDLTPFVGDPTEISRNREKDNLGNSDYETGFKFSFNVHGNT